MWKRAHGLVKRALTDYVLMHFDKVLEDEKNVYGQRADTDNVLTSLNNVLSDINNVLEYLINVLTDVNNVL